MSEATPDAAYVKHTAADLGFALCGITEARPSDHTEHVRQWLAAGKHGEMAYLANRLDVRLDPSKLLGGARSVICVADRLPDPSPQTDDDSRQGRIARYAQVTDYHKVLRKRLHHLTDTLRDRWPNEQYRVCVDTAPILEREHTARAGLGWMGKHTLVISRRLGSHLLLGEIVTTLPLAPDASETDHCGTCTRCIDACPTDCITPYSVDAARCISYLTIEHRSPIDPRFFEPIGDWLFGCDICQEVCPFNRPSTPAEAPEGYALRPASLDVLDVLNWTDADRQAAFVKSAMKRAKLDMMKRNALIVAGNRLRQADDAELRRRIEQQKREDTPLKPR